MKVISLHNQSLIDILAVSTSGIETLFETAIETNSSIDAIPTDGSEISVIVPEKNLGGQLPRVFKALTPKKKVIKNRNQNLQDLAIQTTGSIENLFDFALHNSVSVTAIKPNGYEYKVPTIETEATRELEYFNINKITPATGTETEEIEPTTTYAEDGYVEDNYWE